LEIATLLPGTLQCICFMLCSVHSLHALRLPGFELRQPLLVICLVSSCAWLARAVDLTPTSCTSDHDHYNNISSTYNEVGG